MAKNIYRIRASLNRTIFDYEPPLAFGSGIKIVRPMKVIFFWVGSILVGLFTLFASPIGAAHWGFKIALAIWWIIATLVLSQYTKTKDMRLNSLLPLWRYIPRDARNVSTRQDADSYPLREITGLKKVHPNGLIEYIDGTVGYAYLVVGSGSVLLFDEDKNNVLDRASAFWRRADKDAEYIFITTKEPQRVGSQLKHINEQRKNLDVVDEDLVNLLYENFTVMQQRVGERLSSIHQYLIIKADNLEVLRRAHADLASEIEESSLFIKQCSMLSGESVLTMFRFFYCYNHSEL